MATEPDTPEPSPLDIGRIAAKQLAGSDWQVEVETPLSETSDLVQPSVEESFASQPEQAPAVRSPSSTRIAPPAPEQLVEAMLFVGGQPIVSVRSSACRQTFSTPPSMPSLASTRLRIGHTQYSPATTAMLW
jgi:hypothetical protein